MLDVKSSIPIGRNAAAVDPIIRPLRSFCCFAITRFYWTRLHQRFLRASFEIESNVPHIHNIHSLFPLLLFQNIFSFPLSLSPFSSLSFILLSRILLFFPSLSIPKFLFVLLFHFFFTPLFPLRLLSSFKIFLFRSLFLSTDSMFYTHLALSETFILYSLNV